jgi:hypothetical protein
MEWYHWVGGACLLFCLVVCFAHALRLVRAGRSEDFATPAGSIPEGIRYSFSTAMKPGHKESAFLHLPTYVSGLIFHLGAFFTMALFVIWPWWDVANVEIARMVVALVPAIGGIAGFGLLVKRITKPLLRDLSTPDDYISNFLVTMFQLCATVALFLPAFLPVFYIAGAVLWLYFPAGKLKHAVYFFAARYHLGVLFGSRGVWQNPKQG